jgi:HSP20 family protein
MTLVSLDPMSTLLRLQHDLERFFENPSIDLGFSGRGAFPPLNVFTDADGVVVRAEMPGVKADDLSIEGESGRLTLRGERKSVAPASGSFHRRERPYGTFARSIRLPSDLDFGKSRATYRNGVLTLRIPRAEAAKPRRIQVDAA